MPDHLDRRLFLAGAAATLGALLGERGLSAAHVTAQDDEPVWEGPPVKVALIGVGPWGRELLTHLGRVKPLSLVAVCDSYAPFLKRAQDAAPKAQALADYKAVLSLADVEAVIIATPTHTHREIALAALQAGKHVYCEAPLASTIEDTRAIAQAAKAASRQVFAAGLQGRSNALQKHVWNFVKSGVLGETALVKAQWNKKESWRRPAPTPERERLVNWRLAKATSAGLPGEIGIHHFDLVSSYLDALPTAVSGSGAIAGWADGREIPDSVTCLFDYGTVMRATYAATLTSSFGGSYATFQGNNSSLLIREKRAWLFKEADSALLGWEVYARKEPVHDDVGIALVADATKILAAGKEPGKDGPIEPEQEALYLALDNLAWAVRGKAPVNAGALEGLQATVTAIKAHEATLSGSRIALAPDLFTLT
ncbi:Gfo/Idh/MocA family protein [Luteitalea sp.]